MRIIRECMTIGLIAAVFWLLLAAVSNTITYSMWGKLVMPNPAIDALAVMGWTMFFRACFIGKKILDRDEKDKDDEEGS